MTEDRRGPVRSCAGCRARRPKSELVRVVRGINGAVAVDPSGTAPGRGAYVCPDPRCAALATGRGGLARALRAALGPADLATLRMRIEERGAT